MAKSHTLAAVDLGAGSGRVMAATIVNETLSLTEVHRFTSPPVLQDGLLRWDVEGLERQIRFGIGQIAESVESVAIDTWGVDFVLVGDDDRPVEPPRCYRNEHTRQVLDATIERLGGPALYSRTGIQTMHFNTVFQLAALAQTSGEILAKARSFAMIPDWLIHRLGAPLANEISNASTTQLVDARTRDWDAESLRLLGLNPSIFHTPVRPGAILGRAESLGTRHPALIAPATHDTGSAVAAIPLKDDRSAYICTGTWCLIGIESRQAETGDGARQANFTNEAGVDGTYRFLKNCMGLWLVQQLQASWSECPNFGAMTEWARRAPAFGPLVDADDASFFQPASMKQALEAWWQKTGQTAPRDLGGYVRSCLESLVLVFRKTLRQIEVLRGVHLERIHLVGGGCKNSLLCQLTADATGLPVFAGPVEGSALGNAIVQARALGLVDGQVGARSLVERSFPLGEYRPSGNREAWDRAEKRLESYHF